jgi:hypothetical protein
MTEGKIACMAAARASTGWWLYTEKQRDSASTAKPGVCPVYLEAVMTFG